MTMPRLTDVIRKLIPNWRGRELTQDEQQLGIYLRGNEPLHTALTGIINSRITARASVPVPSEPTLCKSMLDRDSELRWLLSRLDFVYHSPVSQPEPDMDEHPA